MRMNSDPPIDTGSKDNGRQSKDSDPLINVDPMANVRPSNIDSDPNEDPDPRPTKKILTFPSTQIPQLMTLYPVLVPYWLKDYP